VAAEVGTVDHYLLLLALQKAGLSAKDITFKPLATAAAAAAFVAGKVDAVGVFAPFTTTALGRSGSRAVATSRDFPGAIPDHQVVSTDLVTKRPDDVQALVKTWFDTLAWIAAHRAEAVAVMVERAGVSPADYATYDAGTTIFTRRQNLDAFASGSTDAHLDYEARKISDFLVQSKLTDACSGSGWGGGCREYDRRAGAARRMQGLPRAGRGAARTCRRRPADQARRVRLHRRGQRLGQVDAAVAGGGAGTADRGRDRPRWRARQEARARPGTGVPGPLAVPVAHGGGQRSLRPGAAADLPG
jgi:hypothetical protein